MTHHSLEDTLGYRFQTTVFLHEALDHPSADKLKKTSAFERLEFLGDRVLGLVIAQWLYEAFPQAAEGELATHHSHMVKRGSLVGVAKALNLGTHLRFDQQKGAPKLLEKILADGCEAVLGAVFLDGGWAVAAQVIRHFWAPLMDRSAQNFPENPKSSLQEWSQARNLGMPVYRVCGRSGPDHQPLFTVGVTVQGFCEIQASGGSKQVAEVLAAEKMWTYLTREANLL